MYARPRPSKKKIKKMHNKIEILPATPAHVQDIHAIEVLSFSLPWSQDAILSEVNNIHSVCLVAISDGNVIGYISLRHIVNEGHISNIAVLPSWRGNGVGMALLAATTNIAIALEMIGLTLEVRISNAPAISLYKRHGFIVEGNMKNYYSHPTEDAVIMWKYF